MDVLALAGIGAAVAAPTLTGPQFVTLSRSTIDLMRSQHYRLVGQLDRDKVPFFYEATVRAAPGIDFVNRDGAVLRGGLERLGGGYWFGHGKPRTGAAWFATGQMDGAIALVENAGGSDVLLLDGLLMAGVAVKGLSLQGGVQGGVSLGLDQAGQFSMRPSYPPTEAEKRRIAAEPGGFVFSAEHAEGVSLGAVLGRALGANGEVTEVTSLASARALFQPTNLLRRLDLRKLGAPGVGVDAISPDVDYYGEGAGRTETAFEVPLVVDDLAQTGVRVKGVTQVAPVPLFRMVELGWAHQGEHVGFASQGKLFRRNAAWVGSVEAVGGYTVPLFGLTQGTASVSYSYNVPDSVTYFPIPDAHVVGFQLTVGPPEFARPLVPLVARQREEAEEAEDRANEPPADAEG